MVIVGIKDVHLYEFVPPLQEHSPSSIIRRQRHPVSYQTPRVKMSRSQLPRKPPIYRGAETV